MLYYLLKVLYFKPIVLGLVKRMTYSVGTKSKILWRPLTSAKSLIVKIFDFYNQNPYGFKSRRRLALLYYGYVIIQHKTDKRGGLLHRKKQSLLEDF
jgi:hypothetical protein